MPYHPITYLHFLPCLSFTNDILFQDCATKVEERKEPYRELRTLSNDITGSCLQSDAVNIYSNMADIDKQWRAILNHLNRVKKSIDDNYRASKKFFGSYDELITFMTDAEKQLEGEESIGADPAVLKQLLKKHKVSPFTRRNGLYTIVILAYGNHC